MYLSCEDDHGGVQHRHGQGAHGGHQGVQGKAAFNWIQNVWLKGELGLSFLKMKLI